MGDDGISEYAFYYIIYAQTLILTRVYRGAFQQVQAQSFHYTMSYAPKFREHNNE